MRDKFRFLRLGDRPMERRHDLAPLLGSARFSTAFGSADNVQWSVHSSMIPGLRCSDEPCETPMRRWSRGGEDFEPTATTIVRQTSDRKTHHLRATDELDEDGCDVYVEEPPS
jgi:hypothetical protein